MISRLTIREAAVQYAAHRGEDISELYARKLVHIADRFVSHTHCRFIDDIETDTFRIFRDSCVAKGLSRDTIATDISSVLTILRWLVGNDLLAKVPKCRVSVKRVRPNAEQPELEIIGRMYESADLCKWPLVGVPPGVFWRAWLVVSYWTGLRLVG